MTPAAFTGEGGQTERTRAVTGRHCRHDTAVQKHGASLEIGKGQELFQSMEFMASLILDPSAGE